MFKVSFEIIERCIPVDNQGIVFTAYISLFRLKLTLMPQA